ncbi:glycosyltransferase family 2 protein [Lysobacter sp. LF1]|uniref:Glycosyltransferase family 2 protein n=1 Tax=Lysobacter stagni TaxID=3045172 RepID=A0ABT6XJQ1_9GAMM|nr:glycosyltransferase family 2 protein [Lysobacter sp. LF1]MDI9240256.1 glycosyltransferase family 2 protein [Lysobacter sp. LF1]
MVEHPRLRDESRLMTSDAFTAPVSVVVPCYRCGDTIGDAVASIAAQTLPPRQVVLVDDASGDGTVQALHALASGYPRGWIDVVALARNGGPSRARNVGWQQARQEYVAFLDSDDTWSETKLELQMRALRDDPKIVLIAHRMQVRDRAVSPPSAPTTARTRIVPRRRLLLNNPFPTASVVLRRDLPFRFNEDYRRVEDFLLWGQIAFSGYRCAKLDQVLAYWHKPNYGAGGLSEDLRAMHRAGREVRRELLRQGLVSLPEHCFARSVGMLRKSRQRLLLAWRRAQAGGAP